jgi:hypothetical protein
MKGLLGFFGGIILLICFSSCQKEIDWSLTNKPQSDSTYLTKIIGLDTTRPAGMDTTDWTFFTYDNFKRLKRIDAFSNALPVNTDSVTHVYSYQGTDTLPFMFVIDEKYNITFGGTHYQTIVYNYYSNGVISKDSVIELNLTSGTNNGATVSVYQVSGSTVNRYRTLYDFIGGTYVLSIRDTTVYSISVSGGNLVSQTLVSGPGSYQSAQVTYDNNRNPVSKAFKLKYPVFESPYVEVWDVQANNVLHAQFQEPFNPVYNDLYTYKYRPDGYPASSTYNTDQGGTVYNKAFFFYTSL